MSLLPTAFVNGVNLYYEVTGKGFPLVWCHEFAGSFKSWDAQVKFFSRHYKVITYNARGYPPSDVPTEPSAYSQEHSVEDLYQLLRHLGIRQAYVGGLSMGANIALNFGIAHPDVAKALIIAGRGAAITDRKSWESRIKNLARRIENEGMKATADYYTRGPTRRQLIRKDQKSWQEFYEEFASHSAIGSALTLRGVIFARQTISGLESKLRQLAVPTLIMVGDEDEPRVGPALWMKRYIPRSGLAVFPQTGHTINLEEPDLFNRVVLHFLTSVEAGSWA